MNLAIEIDRAAAFGRLLSLVPARKDGSVFTCSRPLRFRREYEKGG